MGTVEERDAGQCLLKQFKRMVSLKVYCSPWLPTDVYTRIWYINLFIGHEFTRAFFSVKIFS